MKRYRITAYLLLLMAALWMFPAPRALAADDEAAEETTSAEGTGSLGLGLAIMNRLRKASGGDIRFV